MALWKGWQAAVTTCAQAARRCHCAVCQWLYRRPEAEQWRYRGGRLGAGLVTALKSEDEVTQRMIELVGSDPDEDEYPVIELGDYVRVHAAEKKLHKGAAGRVAVVMASGEILDGDQPPGTVGGITAAQLLRDARKNDDIAAVVLRVDSPGGSVLASEQIYREVVALKAEGKPVVVSMGDLAASGGYYIAAPADKIFASPMTITGSIGIYATLPTVDRTLGKIGVTVDGVGTTALSGKMRLDRPHGSGAARLHTADHRHGYELSSRMWPPVAARPRDDMRWHCAGPRLDRQRRAAPGAGGYAGRLRRCSEGRSAAGEAAGRLCGGTYGTGTDLGRGAGHCSCMCAWRASAGKVLVRRWAA